MHDQRVNTGHHDFNEQLSFWLNRACGLSYNEVVFLDKFGSVLDAEDLFYELKWDPDIFEAQVLGEDSYPGVARVPVTAPSASPDTRRSSTCEGASSKSVTCGTGDSSHLSIDWDAVESSMDTEDDIESAASSVQGSCVPRIRACVETKSPTTLAEEAAAKLAALNQRYDKRRLVRRLGTAAQGGQRDTRPGASRPSAGRQCEGWEV